MNRKQTTRSVALLLILGVLATPSHTASIPSVQSAQALSEQAFHLFHSDNCSKALPILEEWSLHVNQLAHVVALSLEPYRASNESLPSDLISQVTRMELLAEGFQRQGRQAAVMRAECLARAGELDEAFGAYVQLLESFKITRHYGSVRISDWGHASEKERWAYADDFEWWLRAVNGLYALVGIDGFTVDLKG